MKNAARLGTGRFQRARPQSDGLPAKPGSLESTRTQRGSEEGLMFCPSCGFEYTQKTNYCKRCGEDLSPAGVTDAPNKKQPNVTMMFLAVVVFSLSAMALLLFAHEMFSNRGSDGPHGLNSNDETLLRFVMFFSSAVALLLIWQLARMVTAFRRTGQDKVIEKHFIREVPTIQPVAPTGQIPEAPAAIYPSSVVEHTTRQMAGVYSEPKASK
jgi:hypothetical protein